MLIIRIRIHKWLVRKANREDPDQSDLRLCCLSRHFLQATSVRNFRAFTIFCILRVLRFEFLNFRILANFNFHPCHGNLDLNFKVTE